MKLHAPCRSTSCAILAVLSAIGPLSAAAPPPREPIEIGFEPQLLVDDYLVANRWAVRIKNEEVVHRFHAPTRHSANPLLAGDCGYVNVVRDEEAGVFRMWHQTWCAQWRDNPKHPKYAVAYAESKDGLAWTRPELGLFEWKGSKQNNVCWLGDGVGGASGASIVQAPAEHRRGFKYLLLYSTSNGLNLVGSKDGVHWDAESVTRIKYLHSDTMNNVVYDPKRDRFIAYCRPRYVFRGWVDPRDSGATRRVACMTSKELWTLWEADPAAILIPDRLDTDRDFNFFYGMVGSYYGGVFFGCLWPFKLNTDIYTELVTSRDGVSFDRLPGRPRLLGLGEPGAWDDGMVFGTRWVEVGREWWLYYAGHDGPHGSKTRKAGIGLATIRKEGFVSLHGPARDGGMMCTRVLHWPGGDLVINAETGGESGRLCVRVLTPQREVIDGLGYAACGNLSGDSTSHRVTWAGRTMHELAGRDLRLEFFLEDADLHSFRACLPEAPVDDVQMRRTDNRVVPGLRLLKRGKKGKSAAQVAEDTAHHVRKVRGVVQQTRQGRPAVTVRDGRLTELVLNGRNRVPEAHSVPLWQANLFDVETGTLTRIVPSETGSALKWRWELADPATKATVGVLRTWAEIDGTTVSFRFAVERLDERYALQDLTYPIIPLAALGARGEDDAMLVPSGYGQLIENVHTAKLRQYYPEPAVFWGRYPSKHQALQMVFYHDPKGGLLFTTPDPSRRIKDVVLDRESETSRLRFIHHLSPGVDRAEVSYPVKVRWVDGDWYDAAQIYREWALAQPWAREPGLLRERTDLPDWFKDVPMWLRFTSVPWVPLKQQVDGLLEWQAALKVPVALHWYGWDKHGGPINREWPAHHPPREEFGELIAQFHARGIRVMPYVNARIAAVNGPLWQEFEPAMVRDRDGAVEGRQKWRCWTDDEALAQAARAAGTLTRTREKGGRTYHQIESRFSIACLACAKWQKTILDRTVPLFAEHGVDAVYQDQLGAGAMLCHARGHGHAPGDPDAWLAGLHNVFGEVRSRVRAGGRSPVLISEYLTEGNLGAMDGALTVSPSIQSRRPVPLLPAVYHEYQALIGWVVWHRLLAVDRYQFLHQRMVPLVYGSQLGWYDSLVWPELRVQYPKVAACMNRAAQIRHRFRTSLATGKMLRPPVVEGVAWREVALPDSPQVPARKWPAILAGFFMDAPRGQEAAIVLVNWTGEPQTGILRVDLSELERPVHAEWLDGKSLGQLGGEQMVLPIELASATVEVITMRSAEQEEP